jgi:hypothetical protein
MNYPKQSFTTKKDANNLSGITNGVMLFENYRGDLDVIDRYELRGFYGALSMPEIKVNFKYDYMMNQVKNEYKDSFNRVVRVTKLN